MATLICKLPFLLNPATASTVVHIPSNSRSNTNQTTHVIPNSRPIPNRAVVCRALAIKNRIHMIDPHTPLAMFEEELKKHRRDWLVERIKRHRDELWVPAIGMEK